MEFQKASEDHTPGQMQSYEDYSKYLSDHGSSPANFQEYMDYNKYMSQHSQYEDFSKYMNAQGSPTSFMDFSQFTGANADYQKYMDSKGMDWKQFMDYQKYMSGNGQGAGHSQPAATAAAAQGAAVSFAASPASSSSPQSQGQSPQGQSQQGNYQHYIPDFQKYIPGSGSSQGSGDFQQYMDFSKYMGGGGGNGAGAGDFASKYMGGSGKSGDFQQYMDVSQYMGKYTQKDWMKFQQQQNQQQAQVPYSASDCKTPEELEAWKQRQLDMVHDWIPDAFQKSVQDNVEEEYKKNSERLGMPPMSSDMAAAAAVAPSQAQGSSSSAQVEADPDVEKALAKARAALAHSSSVESPKALLEADLSKQEEEPQQKTKLLQPPLATELAAAQPLEEPTWHPYRAMGVVLLGLSLPAALALFGLGSRPRSPCVSRRNSEDSTTMERYIQLDAGDEV